MTRCRQVLRLIDGVEVVVARLDGPEPIGRAATSLSAAERDRAARFRFDADRRRYIAARSTLRELLAARCGRPPESLQFETGKQGKLLLADGAWHFSASRSGELAAYAFCRSRAVGIDLEAIRPFAAADVVAARALPLREWLAYAALAKRDKPRGFFRAWTRTEALAKALGGGLTMPRAALDAALEHHWRIESFVPAPRFDGAVACSSGGLRP